MRLSALCTILYVLQIIKYLLHISLLQYVEKISLQALRFFVKIIEEMTCCYKLSHNILLVYIVKNVITRIALFNKQQFGEF